MEIEENIMGEKEDAILKVQGLKVYFPHRSGVIKAVEGVDFSVGYGKVLGIVGESGCGKTVTAKSLMRIVDKPGFIAGGSVLLKREKDGVDREVDVSQLKPSSRELKEIRGGDIGLIFQEPMSSFSMMHTVGNQISEALKMHGRWTKKEAREEVIQLLARVGISQPAKRVDSYAFELSGGMRQRAMIALAISCKPRVLIADEPTTALDVTTQAQILELLLQLREQHNMAILMITHNLAVVAAMCVDVVVMYLGQVVESGPVKEIFKDPRYPYTKMLLKSVPSIYAPPKSRLESIKGSIPHPYSRPTGCTFYPRCPWVIKGLCNKTEPESYRVGETHLAKCFLCRNEPPEE
jgi:peptide/nickel transport system ATP-binding protein